MALDHATPRFFNGLMMPPPPHPLVITTPSPPYPLPTSNALRVSLPVFACFRLPLGPLTVSAAFACPCLSVCCACLPLPGAACLCLPLCLPLPAFACICLTHCLSLSAPACLTLPLLATKYLCLPQPTVTYPTSVCHYATTTHQSCTLLVWGCNAAAASMTSCTRWSLSSSIMSVIRTGGCIFRYAKTASNDFYVTINLVETTNP